MGNARDIGFSLKGPISWAGGAAQVEVTLNTVQEGCPAIADAIVEKRTKARGPGHPYRMMKVMRTPTAAYDIEEWMQGDGRGCSQRDVRKGDAVNCSPKWKNAYTQCIG